MANEIYKKSAKEIREMFVTGQLSCLDIVEQNFKRIRDIEPNLGAFISTEEDAALKRASELDNRRSKGEKMGALAAVPVVLKDNICTEGLKTTCASRSLEDFVPPYNAHVVERLLAEDAVIIGKTNMDEFAMGSSTENSAFKVTRNPWDAGKVPGGSSGGSAAAVAARLAPLALGSDTAGSVRQPAALCGVMGMKPTYGRVSRYGVVAFASSMDQIGPIAHNATDMAMLLNAISQPDTRDSTCSENKPPDYLKALGRQIKGMKFGMPREFFETDGISDLVLKKLFEAKETFEKLGVQFREISLPHSRIDIDSGCISSFAVACYYILCTAEAASNLARFDGVRYGCRYADTGNVMDMYCKSRGTEFGDEVKRRIMLGTHVLSSGYYDDYYLKAGKVRRLITEDFERALDEVDIIFAPTTPTPAFGIGEKTEDPLSMYLNDIFTSPCNLAGNCAISIPCGFTDQHLPVGMQMLGKRWNEESLLAAANAYQQRTQWHTMIPSMQEASNHSYS